MVLLLLRNRIACRFFIKCHTEQNGVDYNSGDSQGKQDKEPDAVGNDCPYDHDRPVEEETADEQNCTNSNLPADEPANTKNTDEGEQDFGHHRTIIFTCCDHRWWRIDNGHIDLVGGIAGRARNMLRVNRCRLMWWGSPEMLRG